MGAEDGTPEARLGVRRQFPGIPREGAAHGTTLSTTSAGRGAAGLADVTFVTPTRVGPHPRVFRPCLPW